MLNWPPGNIFRQDSEPKWLQIHQNHFENTQNHPPKKLKQNQKRQIWWKPFFVGKLVRRKSTSYGSSGRSAKWKMLVHWSSFFHTFCKNLISTITKLTFTRCFDLNPSFSWKSTFSFGAIWDLFLEEHIAFCDGFDIILKYDPENDLINTNDPTCHFHEKQMKMTQLYRKAP